ncbi:30S ribosomal protein S28e [uncultured archaeon]|nr:30S ribosomal protein S28e [uncultured archaeon]
MGDPKKKIVESEPQKETRGPPKQETGAISFSFAVPARVEEIIGRTGTRGEAIQVRCRVLDGRDKDKVLRRNVKGPIQKDDLLMLRETEIEARPLSKSGGRGGS